jgi:hypothetical protein
MLVFRAEFLRRELCEHALPVALKARFVSDLGSEHHYEADHLCLRCEPVWIEVVCGPGKVVVHAVEAEIQEMSTFSAARHRFQPLVDSPQKRKGHNLTLASWTLALRALRIGQPALARA